MPGVRGYEDPATRQPEPAGPRLRPTDVRKEARLWWSAASHADENSAV